MRESLLPRMVAESEATERASRNRFIWLGSKFSVFRKKRGIYENRHCYKHGASCQERYYLSCAQMAEEASLEHIWAVDHVAIPPDESEGSDGIWLILSQYYRFRGRDQCDKNWCQRPGATIVPLAHCKVGSKHSELSNERLLLGVGPG